MSRAPPAFTEELLETSAEGCLGESGSGAGVPALRTLLTLVPMFDRRGAVVLRQLHEGGELARLRHQGHCQPTPAARRQGPCYACTDTMTTLSPT